MKQTYNIRIRNLNKSDEYPDDTRLVPVEGKIIETHELLPIKFFIHRTLLYPGEYSKFSWTVTEFETGFSMASGKTQKESLGQLSGRIDSRGLTIPRMQGVIADNVNRYGKAN